MSTTQQIAIKAAMSVARDVTEGRIDPDELGRVAAGQCRELFGTAAGPDDALWTLHVDVARQVLALGGLPADELAEWLAVARQRAGGAAQPSTPRQGPGTTESSAGGSHSPENSDVRPAAANTNTIAPQDNADNGRHSDETGDSRDSTE